MVVDFKNYTSKKSQLCSTLSSTIRIEVHYCSHMLRLNIQELFPMFPVIGASWMREWVEKEFFGGKVMYHGFL
jgi:hypothetical protein